MRNIILAALAALSLAGCVPAPRTASPASLAAQRPPASPREQMADRIFTDALVDRGSLARNLQRGAESLAEGVVPRPTGRQPSREWDGAVLQEKLWLTERVGYLVSRAERQAAETQRASRQNAYCLDLSHDAALNSANSGVLSAHLFLGSELPAQRRLYDQCMNSFRRTDIYLGR